jgi:peroxiredoxin
MDETTLKPGDEAEHFTLKNQWGKEVKLTAFFEIGQRVLLSFHPLAWTSVCEIQMKALELKYDTLEDLETKAVGISVDSVPAKKEWSKAIGVEKTDFLSDFWPHGEIAKKYDLFIEEKGISKRANVIVGKTGKIEWVKVYDIPEVPDIEEVIRFLKS